MPKRSRRAAAGVSASRCAPGAALPPELAERQADDEREDKPQHECTRLAVDPSAAFSRPCRRISAASVNGLAKDELRVTLTARVAGTQAPSALSSIHHIPAFAVGTPSANAATAVSNTFCICAAFLSVSTMQEREQREGRALRLVGAERCRSAQGPARFWRELFRCH
jgi:hypothetical protein